MNLIRVGIDLAKNVFQLHGVDRCEKVVWRKKLVSADSLAALLEKNEWAEGSAWKPMPVLITGPGNCKSEASP